MASSNSDFKSHYPADSFERQPVHTVYGGANLFKAGFTSKLGEIAIKTLDTYAPNYAVFARALGLQGAETLPTSSFELAGLTRALMNRSRIHRLIVTGESNGGTTAIGLVSMMEILDRYIVGK